jgi:hypothetical protein
MEMSAQIYAPAPLPPSETTLLVTIVWEAGWAPEAKGIYCLYRESNPDFSVV